jgi:hypothetical protein
VHRSKSGHSCPRESRSRLQWGLSGPSAVAVVLDFMNPQATGGQRIGFGGQTWGDEAGW